MKGYHWDLRVLKNAYYTGNAHLINNIDKFAHNNKLTTREDINKEIHYMLSFLLEDLLKGHAEGRYIGNFIMRALIPFNELKIPQYKYNQHKSFNFFDKIKGTRYGDK